MTFSLRDAAPARLEIFDLSGRSVLAREVGLLGAGDHVVRLERSAGMRPGVYWGRLTQAGRGVTAKGVVVQ